MICIEALEYWLHYKNGLDRYKEGERWKIIFKQYHCYASVEEHKRKIFPWKAWLFKCLHILNKTSNSLKMRPNCYATCLCSPVYIFLCTVLVTLPRLGQISYHFDDSRTLQYTPILYMLGDQHFDRFHTVSFTMQSQDQNSTLIFKTGWTKTIVNATKDRPIHYDLCVPECTQRNAVSKYESEWKYSVYIVHSKTTKVTEVEILDWHWIWRGPWLLSSPLKQTLFGNERESIIVFVKFLV